MGIRHLVITDIHNQVVGIITKKDLMQFAIEEKVKATRRSLGSHGQTQLDFSPKTLPKDTKLIFKNEKAFDEKEEKEGTPSPGSSNGNFPSEIDANEDESNDDNEELIKIV